MRVLLDECVNPRLKQAFLGHYVVTVPDVEWRQLPDNLLLRAANGTFGIIIVHVEKNRIGYYRPLFDALLAAVERVRPGEVIHVTGRADPV